MPREAPIRPLRSGGLRVLSFALAAGDDRPSRFVRIVASTAPFAAGDPLPEGAGR